MSETIFVSALLFIIIQSFIIIRLKADIKKLGVKSHEDSSYICDIEGELDELKQLRTALNEDIAKLKKQLKDAMPDDLTEQTIKELAGDLKTHGFNFIRINPDHVFLRQ